MASKSARKRRKRRPPRPPADVAASPPDSAEPAEPPRAPAPRRGAVARGEEPPPPPWGSFPLIELSVLTGLIMLVAGFFFVEGERGAILIGFGLLLGSIGGLELSIREHFAGYKSHTVILAGLPALIVLGVLFYAVDSLAPILRAAIGLAVFAVAALLLSRAFAARSGGARYRFSTRRRGPGSR
jgi:hypothetical protein